MRKSQTPITAQDVLIQRHSIFKSWAVVSEELGGVNRGMLCAVAGGKKLAPRPLIDKMNEVYNMHLPYETKIAVTPCARCGNVHVTKRCTAVKSPRRYDGGVVRWNRIERPAMQALACLYDKDAAIGIINRVRERTVRSCA